MSYTRVTHQAAFDTMKKMGDAFVESAMIEAHRPPEVPLDQRRFTPKEALQKEGELTRAQAVEFLDGVCEMLTSDETLDLLATQCPGQQQALIKRGLIKRGLIKRE